MRKVIDEMKIQIGSKVYLQKYDLFKITRELNFAPTSIKKEAERRGTMFHLMEPNDAWNFDCVFSDPANVKWLMSQDWILDYRQFRRMPTERLAACRAKLDRQYKAEADAIGKMCARREEHLRRQCTDYLVREQNRLQSLDLLINGQVNGFHLPREFYTGHENDHGSDHAGHSRFFMRFLRRSAV